MAEASRLAQALEYLDSLDAAVAPKLRAVSDAIDPVNVARRAGLSLPTGEQVGMAAHFVGPGADIEGMVNDAREGNAAIGRGDLLGALGGYGSALAAIPMMALPGSVKDVKAGVKALSNALPMDEASRMARGMTEDEFIKHHRTGFIQSDAYQNYEAPGGLSWLGGPKVEPITSLPEHYTVVSDRGRDGSQKYFMWDTRDQFARDRRLFDTQEEAAKFTLNDVNQKRGVGRSKDEIYPEILPPISGKDGKTFEVRRSKDGTSVAFDGDKPVGFSSNEFGTAGVWVEGPHQGQGIGSELLTRFMREHPNMKIGQMTPAGEKMSRAAYRKLYGQGGE
jgi:GNAT superfamily N-acetyltransferase